MATVTVGGRATTGSRQARAQERRRTVLTATVQSMASHGFRGATLEVIAEAAGMARGHVRYFAGNRDDLLAEAARFFYFGELALTETDLGRLAASAPLIADGADLTTVLDYLFGEFAVPGAENAAVSAFVDASRTLPAVRETIAAAYQGLEESIAVAIADAHPTAPRAAARATSYAVLSLALGNNYIGDVDGLKQHPAAARAGAEQLIESLG